MAVITRFIIVRNGIELDKVFEVKKEADAYDKMLDAAENLAAFIKQSAPPIDLDAKTVDAVSIYLAKNAPEVTRILKGLKPAPPAASPKVDTERPQDPVPIKGKKTPAGKTKTKRPAK